MITMYIIKESLSKATERKAHREEADISQYSQGPDLFCWPILRSGCRFRGSQSHCISQVDAQGSSSEAKESFYQQQGQEERAAEKQEAQNPQETLAGETVCSEKPSPE